MVHGGGAYRPASYCTTGIWALSQKDATKAYAADEPELGMVDVIGSVPLVGAEPAPGQTRAAYGAVGASRHQVPANSTAARLQRWLGHPGCRSGGEAQSRGPFGLLTPGPRD